jgi:hypothetical protein
LEVFVELKDFVKTVLTQIDAAVDEARAETSRDIRFSEKDSKRTIEFDVAVSAENTDSKSGKAGVRVLEFVEGGGEISKENKSSTVSRITFGLRIESRTKEEAEQAHQAVMEHNRRNSDRLNQSF